MPRWQIRGTDSPVRISPAKRTLPCVGLSTPVIRLNSVDFPAPFGPMTARTSPSSTCIATWSTATSPPNRRVRSWSSSNATTVFQFGRAATSARAGVHEAPDVLRREHHEADKDETEEQCPGLDVVAELVFDSQKKGGAEDRTD